MRRLLPNVHDRDGRLDPIKLAAVVFTLVMLLALLVANYWLLIDDRVPVEYFNEPIPVEGADLQPGDTLYVLPEFCRHTDAPVTIYRSFRNALVYESPEQTTGGADAGECGQARLPVTIPETLPGDDEYTIHWRFVYQVNPLAQRVVNVVSEPFYVGAGGE